MSRMTPPDGVHAAADVLNYLIKGENLAYHVSAKGEK